VYIVHISSWIKKVINSKKNREHLAPVGRLERRGKEKKAKC